MSLTLPIVTIEGTLTADPDLRFTQSSTAVANLNIACNTRRKNPQTDQWEDGDTTFVRGTVWKKLAENVADSLKKGDRVLAQGTLKQNNFEDKQGNKRSTLELEITDIGASLRFATATTERSSGGNGGGGRQQANPGWGDGDADGW
ncbi:ssDNA binding protein [Mycobacterium phage Aziz]|uniref:Single-stranded DNA-binding protein n=2 Tax=Reyvirus TaxID=1623301 RepID=A0A7G9A2E5_9CAUD|nr:ssDNA binding protein [Mycobacterium phage Aziz]YP_010013830.1 ssDNA binding protein [Mycobacterium phage Estes]ASR75921.1 ssDNA binding protein [Mycobacterium phage GenevaB15]QNJ56734.1 ssDNA-binding protein [Mycobacterium phage Aziz]QNL30784.1 ssDNA-binding protein [Mycobacterium phage Estes]